MIFSTFEISNDYVKLLEQATTMPNFCKKISNNYRDFKIANYLNFYCVAYKKKCVHVLRKQKCVEKRNVQCYNT